MATQRVVDVLVVGGGFGGAFCAERLERLLRDRPGRVLLVAPESFLLFSPLLPEAASGTLEPRHAVVPLREMLHSTELVTGDVTAVDLDARTATVVDLNGEESSVCWRTAVLSPGAVPAIFPIPGLDTDAVGFKTLSDAIWLRNRVLRQLEAAEAATDRAERRRLLTFVFVGGGYAGVEALAELESLVRDAVADYRTLRHSDTRWVLVEASPTLLPGLDPKLADYTVEVLRRRGVEVHLSTRMTSCVGRRVEVDDEAVEPFDAGLVVWTAGQKPSSLGADLGLDCDERGRVLVDDHLRPTSRADGSVYVVGDMAAVPDPSNPGQPCPATAQHAVRQGRVAATNVAAHLGVGAPAAFAYKNRGLAVTLGRNQGTAQLFNRTFRGFLAWWMGRSYHLIMLPGWGRRARIVSDWTLGLLFKRDVSQLGTLGQPTRLGG